MTEATSPTAWRSARNIGRRNCTRTPSSIARQSSTGIHPTPAALGLVWQGTGEMRASTRVVWLGAGWRAQCEHFSSPSALCALQLIESLRSGTLDDEEMVVSMGDILVASDDDDVADDATSSTNSGDERGEGASSDPEATATSAEGAFEIGEFVPPSREALAAAHGGEEAADDEARAEVARQDALDAVAEARATATVEKDASKAAARGVAKMATGEAPATAEAPGANSLSEKQSGKPQQPQQGKKKKNAAQKHREELANLYKRLFLGDEAGNEAKASGAKCAATGTKSANDDVDVEITFTPGLQEGLMERIAARKVSEGDRGALQREAHRQLFLAKERAYGRGCVSLLCGAEWRRARGEVGVGAAPRKET